jgi:uncharacterized surface protein with fasciclin (FAS1) repeats
MKIRLLSGLALCVMLGAGSFSSAADEQNIYENIANDSNYTILLSAITESRLVATLNTNEGANTFFAPTDEAFKKLGQEQLKKLIEDKELLKKIIMAHFVADKTLFRKDLKGMGGKELNGFPITVDDGIKIGNAKITAFDIKCKNGVIHKVDTVLIPAK